jgi:hypothetical protein
MNTITPDTVGLLRREFRDVHAIVSNIDRRSRQPSHAGSSPRAILVRVACCHALAARHKSVAARIAAEVFGNDRAVLDGLAVPGAITKAAIAPAQTTVAGWASELAGGIAVGPFATLAPSSIYAQLSARAAALRINLAGVGGAKVPSRSPPGTAPNPFVGEGQPIPAWRGFLNGVVLTARKASLLSAFAEEMLKATTNVEAVVQAVLEADVSAGVDGVLLSNVAADTVRPPGLLAGVTPTTATAGGGLAAFSGDVRALAAAIVVSGALRDPVLLMSSTSALLLATLSQGGAADMPIIAAPTVPAKMLIMIDAANFASAEGDNTDISASTEAVFHEESAAPLPISTPGAPATVAAPVRSTWQTNCVSLRLIQDLGWTLTRSGRVAFIDPVTW